MPDFSHVDSNGNLLYTDSPLNANCYLAGTFFIAFFTLECLLKIFAMGFYSFYGGAYCNDWWNRLDLFIVITGLLSLTSVLSGKLSVIRVIRALRPLKTISAIPGTLNF